MVPTLKTDLAESFWVNMDSKTTEYLDEGDVEATDSASNSQDSPPPVVTDSELPPDLPGLEAVNNPVSGAGESLVEMLPGADNLIDGPKTSGKIGGEVTTEVFGVKGTGSRFVYVFDRSKSMDGYDSRPMIAARRELLKSIESLNKTNQFQIIFYNAATRVFNFDGQAKLFMATDDIKTQAKMFINSTHPEGGTDHINALKVAFRLNPDVIFLLTDAEGGFTKNEMAHLARFRGVATINAIQFGVREGKDRSLQLVAEQSGGTFAFKDIRTLRTDGR